MKCESPKQDETKKGVKSVNVNPNLFGPGKEYKNIRKEPPKYKYIKTDTSPDNSNKSRYIK